MAERTVGIKVFGYVVMLTAMCHDCRTRSSSVIETTTRLPVNASNSLQKAFHNQRLSYCRQKPTQLWRVYTERGFEQRMAKKGDIVPVAIQPPVPCSYEQLKTAGVGMAHDEMYSRKAPDGHCRWTLDCLTQIGRVPTIWWEARLQEDNMTCHGGAGICVLNYVNILTLTRRGCNFRGKSIWVMSREEYPAKAACVLDGRSNDSIAD